MSHTVRVALLPRMTHIFCFCFLHVSLPPWREKKKKNSDERFVCFTIFSIFESKYMDSPSWKIKELMEQIRHDVEQTNETMSLLISELEKQKIENERRNNEQLAQIAEERRKWDEEKARMQRITSLASDIIILNVGGERMYTYRSTLTIDPDSDLAAMFSGKWEDVIPKDKDGYVFLDFDPNVSMNLIYS